MIRPTVDKDIYELSGVYLCECDLEQKEHKQIETVNGEVTLYTPQKYNNNHRTAHPNIGKIVAVYGNTQFKVGQEIICKHFTFQTEEKEPKPSFIKDGVMYFKVYNQDVMYGIEDDGQLTCREGIVLCEPIEDKLINTFLEVSAEYVDYRRDVVKVIKTWKGDKEFKKGDYLFLEKGGDYHFNFNGTDYVKCDHYFDDIMAIMDSPDYKSVEVLTHAKNHSIVTDKETDN